MEAMFYLPRAYGRAMGWAVAVAMASPSAAEDGAVKFASLYQSTGIQAANSVSGSTPSRAPLRRLSTDDPSGAQHDEDDDFDIPKFNLIKETADIRSTNSSCGSSGITNCFEADTVLGGCTKTVNELPLACRPFKLYHREHWESDRSLVNKPDVFVPRSTDFTLTPVGWPKFLYTDISFQYDKGGVKENITRADVDQCEKKPHLEERKDIPYYVIRSKTLSPAGTNLGTLDCDNNFPDVRDVLVETVFEGEGPDKSADKLQADNLRSELIDELLKYRCGFDYEHCAKGEAGTLDDRIVKCFEEYKNSRCPPGDFTGRFTVKGLKNRCTPLAKRLVYRMPTEVTNATRLLEGLRSGSGSERGSQAKLDFQLDRIVFKGNKGPECTEAPSLIELDEQVVANAEDACRTLELNEQDTGIKNPSIAVHSTIAIDNNLIILKPSIENFPFNKSSLVITKLCNVHKQVDVSALFFFSFTITFPTPKLVSEAAYYRSNNTLCDKKDIQPCAKAHPPLDGCAQSVHNLPPNCRPFEVYHVEELSSSTKALTGDPFVVRRKANFTSTLVKGLKYQHTDIFFRYYDENEKKFKFLKEADISSCETKGTDYTRNPKRLSKPIGEAGELEKYFVLQSTILPTEDVDIGHISCTILPHDPYHHWVETLPRDPYHIWLETVFWGNETEFIVFKSSEKLQAENRETESHLDKFGYYCDEDYHPCAESKDGGIQARIQECFAQYKNSECASGNFTGSIRAEKLKNRCNPSAERLVYRMPENATEAFKALNYSASQSGSEAKFSYHLETIHFSESGREECQSQPKLYELHEDDPQNATEACGESLPESLPTATAISKDNGLQIANPTIKSFPLSNSSLAITNLCDVHNRTEVQANFTFQFNVTIPTTTTTTPTTTAAATTTTPTTTTMTTAETELEEIDELEVETNEEDETNGQDRDHRSSSAENSSPTPPPVPNQTSKPDGVNVHESRIDSPGEKKPGDTGLVATGHDSTGGGAAQGGGSGGSGGTSSTPDLIGNGGAVAGGNNVQGGGTNAGQVGEHGSSSEKSSSTLSPQPQVILPAEQGNNSPGGTAQTSTGGGRNTAPAGEQGAGGPKSPPVTSAPESPSGAPPKARPPKPPAPAPEAETSTAAASPLRVALSAASGLSLSLIVLLTMGVTRY